MSPLDPFRAMTDAELVSALERAWWTRNTRVRFLITVEMQSRARGRRGQR